MVDLFTPEPSLFYQQVVTLPRLDPFRGERNRRDLPLIGPLPACSAVHRKESDDYLSIANSLRLEQYLIVSARIGVSETATVWRPKAWRLK